MQITFPDDVGISADEVKQEVAILLYQRGRVSLAQAASIAGVPRLDFQRLLSGRDIPIHYTIEDVDTDLENLRKLDSSGPNSHS